MTVPVAIALLAWVAVVGSHFVWGLVPARRWQRAAGIRNPGGFADAMAQRRARAWERVLPDPGDEAVRLEMVRRGRVYRAAFWVGVVAILDADALGGLLEHGTVPGGLILGELTILALVSARLVYLGIVYGRGRRIAVRSRAASAVWFVGLSLACWLEYATLRG